MKKIIVAGASGFLGSSLVKRLLEEDTEIWALDKFFKKGVLPVSDRLITIVDDAGINELIKAFDDGPFDCFYNLAWQGVNGPEKAQYSVQVNNVMLSLRYAEMSKLLKCKKYLCAGTIAERAIDSLSSLKDVSGSILYSAAKNACRVFLEAYCKSEGIDYVWMQFANIYGPNNKTGNLISYTLNQLEQNLPASFGPAEQPYDFLYVDDLIEAICRLGLLVTHNNYYYVGSSSPMILKEYLKIVGNVFGRPDLIHIGERQDDGIRYSFDMMDNTDTLSTIGNYISDSFENHIRYTINNY